MAKRKDRADEPVEEELESEEIQEFFDEEVEEEESDPDDLELGDDEERPGDEDSEDDDDIILDEDDDDDDDIDLVSWFLETAGYNEDYDWSSLPEEERTRHEELLTISAGSLEKLRIQKMPVLERWAAAQSFSRLENPEGFQDACRSILRARSKHKGLAYDEIYLELISDLAEHDGHEEAFAYLEKFFKQFPKEEEVYTRVRGLLLIESGKIHDGKTLLDEHITGNTRNGESYLEIGDELVALGHPELALTFLKRGKTIARKRRDPELITALDDSMRMAHDLIEQGD